MSPAVFPSRQEQDISRHNLQPAHSNSSKVQKTTDIAQVLLDGAKLAKANFGK